MDFAKSHAIFGHFFGSKNDSNYSDEKLQVSKNDNTNNFRLVQRLSMGGSDMKQFMRLKIELVIAAVNFGGEQNFVPYIGKNNDNKQTICVTVLRCNVDKQGSSYAEDRLFARKMEEEKSHQNVHVNSKLDDFFIYSIY